MRILGPDGKPIESGPPVAPEVRQRVDHAKAVAAEGEPHSALQQLVFAFQQDVSSDLVIDTTIELLESMVKLAGASNSQELEIFRNIKNHRNDPAAYQQAGHWFAQSQQFFVAFPFFRRAKELLGDARNELSQAVDMGLAQVLMSLGAYEQAVNTLHELNDKYGSLPPWLLMELAECYALLRQLEAAEAVYQIAPPEAFEQFAEFPALPMIREEVGDLIARVRDFDEVDEMQLGDWHYVQTRGILIEMNQRPDPGQEQIAQAESGAAAEPADGAVATAAADTTPSSEEEEPTSLAGVSGRFVYFAPSEENVAYVVSLSAAFLDAKGYAPTRILWLGETSEPLARLFAEWWEIEPAEIREYRHGDNTDEESNLALLVMAHSYDVNLSLPVGVDEPASPDAMNQVAEEQFFDLMQARAGLIVYALDLRWTERQAMAPDIAGFMTQQCSLPWETRFQVVGAQGAIDFATGPDGQPVPEVELAATNPQGAGAPQVVQIVESRSAEEVARDIAKLFPESEECDKLAAELVETYSICSDLILDHRDGTLMRRPMVTHSPIKSPRLGF